MRYPKSKFPERYTGSVNARIAITIPNMNVSDIKTWLGGCSAPAMMNFDVDGGLRRSVRRRRVARHQIPIVVSALLELVLYYFDLSGGIRTRDTKRTGVTIAAVRRDREGPGTNVERSGALAPQARQIWLRD